MTLVMQPRGGLRTKDIKLKRFAQLNKKHAENKTFESQAGSGMTGRRTLVSRRVSFT